MITTSSHYKVAKVVIRRLRRCIAGVIAMLAVAVPSAAEDLEFSIDPITDTFLTFESVVINSIVSNRGVTRIPARPMVFGNGFLEVRVFDSGSGHEIQTRGAEVEYAPGAVEDYDGLYIESGETQEGSLNLSRAAVSVDTLTRIWFWPSGRYRAVFRWYYDPWLRPTINTSGFLMDSIEFVVLEPSGEALDALDRFMCATRALHAEQQAIASIQHNEGLVDDPISAATIAREQYVRSCWDIAEDHPNTPYAKEALSRIDFMMSSRIRLPDGVTESDFAKRFALMAPNRIAARRRMASVAENLVAEQRITFLRQIRDSVPATMAGKFAQELLSAEEIKDQR